MSGSEKNIACKKTKKKEKEKRKEERIKLVRGSTKCTKNFMRL